MWRAWNNLQIKIFTKSSFNSVRKFSHKNIDISEEVRYALEHKHPIVALESTIITHGMPYPDNVQCAMEVEAIVRERGAVPATIAILGGKIKVGLNSDELLQLADTRNNETIKTSRRDFGYVMANKRNGGTTVAGTLIVANTVGIRVFATGGIGGVHREGEHTFDISADLTELGKSPVAVISSGVKSILDIPKTLEYLETQGVFVATFGENKAFPAFYCRSSGYDSPYKVERAKEAADIIRCHLELGLQSGLLFAVPVPEEFAMNEKEMNAVIEQSMTSAKKTGVSGKQITPYLLSHIAWLTKGTSLKTNVALIKNNARVAADIAVELAELCQKHSFKIPMSRTKEGEKTIENQPVIIGGSILDCCATLKGTDITLDGRIHDATFKMHAGGVGRNITEALSKLDYQPTLISVVGNDSHGEYLHSLLPPSCSKSVEKLTNYSTAQCTIIFDSNGECKMLIGDMEVHQQITPDMIKRYEKLIKKSSLLVLDANLSLSTLSAALKIAEEHNVPVFFEPTDVPVSSKPFQTAHWKAIKYITPNLIELKEIANTLNIPLSTSRLNKIEEAAFIAKLVLNYIPNVIVTLGSNGLLMARRADASDPLFQKQGVTNTTDIKLRHYPADEVHGLVNVSGAGDCLASGLIAAMLKGLSEEQCVQVGFAAARAALYSDSAVPTVLFDQLHESWASKAKYVVID